MLRRKSIGEKIGISTSLLENEAYRTARVNLSFLLSTKAYKKVVITSAMPGEGKTTTCLNLAISFAKANKKVLIIDGDLRNPVIHKVFEQPLAPGLSDVLIGFKELQDCINETPFDNLRIITAGTIPPNPADLLVLPSFLDMMDKLMTKFDIIFLDTPPVNLYADALSVANNMDGTILVTKYNWTKREILNQTIAKYKKIDAKIFGVILNNYDSKKYVKQISYGKYGNYVSATK